MDTRKHFKVIPPELPGVCWVQVNTDFPPIGRMSRQRLVGRLLSGRHFGFRLVLEMFDGDRLTSFSIAEEGKRREVFQCCKIENLPPFPADYTGLVTQQGVDW